MVVLSCLIPNSEFTTDDVDVVGAAAILNVHSPLHSASALVASTPRAPRLERPKLQLNASTEEWNAFLRRWETFRIGSSFLNAVRSVRSGPLPHGYKERQRHANSKPPLIRHVAIVRITFKVKCTIPMRWYTMFCSTEWLIMTFVEKHSGKDSGWDNRICWESWDRPKCW